MYPKSINFALSVMFLFIVGCHFQNEVPVQRDATSKEPKNSLGAAGNNSHAEEMAYLNIKPFLVNNLVIYRYNPGKLNIAIRHMRPHPDGNTVLCIPAAYTAKNMSIDGFFVEQGVCIQSLANQALNGGCIITGNKIAIIPIRLFPKKLGSGQSYFQQTLLLSGGKTVPCSIFGNIPSQRRALARFKDGFSIVVSQQAITISAFQEALKVMGAIDAINLDMGSWSEGWYITPDGHKITIGENRASTHLQSNWLVLTR